jgi:putative transposase
MAKLRRIIYNFALREIYKVYTPSFRWVKAKNKKTQEVIDKEILNHYDFDAKKTLSKKFFTSIRDNLRHDERVRPFIMEFNGSALNRIIQCDLYEAFAAIFDERKSGLPKPRKKVKSKNKFSYERQTPNSFLYFDETNELKVPKLGKLKLAEPLRFKFNDNIKIVTIKEEAGKYYISLTMDNVVIETFDKTGVNCGIDWGIKTFLTIADSENNLYTVKINKKKLISNERIVARRNKQLKKKVRNSKNYDKARKKLNAAHKHKWAFIKDQCHKISSEIVKRFDRIVIEDFKMTFMTKNKKLAKKAYEGLYYTFKTQLIYKGILRAKDVVLADSSYPSTQTCSCCGNILVKENKLKLSQRVYRCSCGYNSGRDRNASINLLNYSI